MSKERKAELQRKLAMTTVPRPPADLLDRLKADIPVDLGATPERDRSLWRSALVMRVAASLMLLVTTGLVTWRVLQPGVRPAAPVSAQRAAQREPLVPAVTRSVTRPSEEKVEAPPVAETASRVLEAPIVIPQSVPVAAPAQAPAPVVQTAAAEEARDFAVLESATPMADAVESPARPQVESITVTASAPVVNVTEMDVSAPAAAPPPPPPPAPPAVSAQRATVGGVARKEAAADSSGLAGVSVAAEEFARVRDSLARGVRPAAVDVEAIIHHFARHIPPAEGPSQVTTELTAAPLQSDRLLLRVSIDTSAATPAADARLSVTFSNDAIASVRRLGGEAPLTPGSESPDATSATIVYELTPRAALPAEAIVAKVDLESRRQKNSVTVTADETSSWAQSTRRHRLATLSGLWAESLARPSTDPKLAALAKQLRERFPGDRLVAELEKVVADSVRVSR